MYAVYNDGSLIYAPNVSNRGYTISSPKITYELNKAGSFEFILPCTNPMYAEIKKLKSIITVFQDNVEIWRGRVLNDEKDFNLNKSVFCEGELAFLNDVWHDPYDYSEEGITIDSFFSAVMNYYNGYCSSNRTLYKGSITAVDGTSLFYPVSSDYKQTFSILKDELISQYGGFLRIRKGSDGKRYLDWVDDIGSISSQTIRFGEGLLDIDEYIDATESYSYMIPIGAEDEDGNVLDISSVNEQTPGKKYIYSSEAEELFGKIYKVVTFSEIEDAKELYDAAMTMLSDSVEMSVTITIKAIDLHLIDVHTDGFSIGDYILVVSIPHGINNRYVLNKMVLDLVDPENNEYTLGAGFTALTDEQVASTKLGETAISVAENAESVANGVSSGQMNYVTLAVFNGFVTEVNNRISELEKEIEALKQGGTT